MEQETVLYKGIDALYTMKENLLELEGYKSQSSELAMKEDQLEKQIEYKERAIVEEISAATKKRRLEVEASFDEQVDKIKSRIKKVKAKKDKEKDVQISERIKIETADFTTEKIRLKEEMKAVFQKNHISSFFNNSLYHALFLPRCIKDICSILLTILIVLFVLPYLVVYQLLLPHEVFYLVIDYIITVVIFGGLYLLINEKTKGQHTDAVIDMRAIRAKQAKNQKKIDAIAKDIRKDKDESAYGLESFTGEIEELENDLKSVAEEKKEAMVEFETKTISIIEAGIRADKKEEMESLKASHAQIYNEQKKAEEKVKLYSLEITNNYEKFIGKDFMSVAKIDKLIEIIQSGQANIISEAIAISRKESQMSN
jgi:hypothetical protein